MPAESTDALKNALEEERPAYMKQYKKHLSPNSCQVKFAQLFNMSAGMLIMSAATIYALFGDDIRMLYSPPSGDEVWYGVTTFVLVLFFFELIAFSLASKGYLFSFFFVLDVVAVVTMVLDIPPLWNELYVLGGGDLSEVSNIGGETTNNLRAVSRSAKAGAKAAKMLKVIRIIRLVRVIKLYKYFKKRKEDSKEGTEEEDQEKFSEDLSGSDIGVDLSDRTTLICVVVVLVMLLTTTFLEVSPSVPSPMAFKLQRVAALGELGDINDPQQYHAALEDYQSYFNERLFRFYVPPNKTVLVDRVDNVRAVELEKYPFDVDVDGTVDYVAWVSIKEDSILESWKNICLSVFVIALLGTAVYQFSKTTNEAVVVPIERMVKFVGQLATNPLGKIKPSKGAAGANQGFETTMLENTLMKLGGLLQVSFGVAGSEIIGKNLSADGLDVMIPGQKIFAVFGFCDIQHFNDIAGVLQTETMLFVNQIAEIVHERTHKFGGAANKNTGNAFLLVWKFPKRDSIILDATKKPIIEQKTNAPELHLGDDAESKELQGHVANPAMRLAVQNLTEQALTAFVHTIIQIATHQELQHWRTHPELVKYDPNYDIDMGFGLHIGWSIEGAIGSNHKVDASYLSPNVNMSARLEGATKQFGVKLLFSGVFYGLMQPEVQKLCRMLDRITVKGSLVPIDIYTFDMPKTATIGGHNQIKPVHLTDLVQADDDPNSAPNSARGEGEVKNRGKLGARIKSKIPRSSAKVVPEAEEPAKAPKREKHNEPEYTPANLLAALITLQVGMPTGFVSTFNKASRCYIKGEWPQAKELLGEVTYMMPEDKPTKVLLRVMGEYGFNAPADWKGFRALTSK